MNRAERVVILAPHTDDGEFGCGGAIAKYVENGSDVYYVAFSSADKSVPDGLPPDILRREVMVATERLGIKKDNLIIFDYPVRNFYHRRQDILEDMVRICRSINPDVVFLPSYHDTHQDHQTIVAEGFRAFKKSSLLGYELPWNNISFNTGAFIFLDESHVNNKINAIKAYESQSHRDYVSEDYLRSLARTRGTQIGQKYAEAFEVIRWLIK